MATPPPRPPQAHRRVAQTPAPATSGTVKKGQATGLQRHHIILIALAIMAILLLLLLLAVAAGLGAVAAFSSGGGGGGGGGVAAADNASSGSGAPGSGSDDDPGGSQGIPPAEETSDGDPGQQGSDSDTTAAADASGSGSSGGAPSAGSNVYTIPGGEFFGIEAEGTSFVYVVDCSGSMSGRPFDRAKEEMIRSISSLQPDQSFFLIFFSDDEYPMYHPAVAASSAPATQDNIRKAASWVRSFSLQGGTAPGGALLHALRLQPDAIYFLTDGGFDAGAVSQVRNANSNGVSINTVSFVNRSGEGLMRQIAKENNGVYLFVP